MAVLPQRFYARPAIAVAQDLLGKTLCVAASGGAQRCRIVETEAYVGPHDLACHAARGRTARTDIMFGPGGRAYVYFVYGLHDMLNVVTGKEGEAEAVLVRAAEGLGPMAEARLDGPARLTRALGITVSRHNRLPLDAPPLWLEDGTAPGRIEATPRIGVDYAGEWAAAPLRFVDADSSALSRPLRPAPQTPRARAASD